MTDTIVTVAAFASILLAAAGGPRALALREAAAPAVSTAARAGDAARGWCMAGWTSAPQTSSAPGLTANAQRTAAPARSRGWCPAPLNAPATSPGAPNA